MTEITHHCKLHIIEIYRASNMGDCKAVVGWHLRSLECWVAHNCSERGYFLTMTFRSRKGNKGAWVTKTLQSHKPSGGKRKY